MSMVDVPFGVWAHIPKRPMVSPPNPSAEPGGLDTAAIQLHQSWRFESTYTTKKCKLLDNGTTGQPRVGSIVHETSVRPFGHLQSKRRVKLYPATGGGKQ